MSADGTTTTASGTTITLEAMLNAMRQVDLLPQPTEWTLLSPSGQVWRGTPEDLLQILLPHHPLLRPMSPMDAFKNPSY